MAPGPPIDLTSPEAVRDAHRLLAQLRVEYGPLAWSDRHHAWMTLDHPTSLAGFRDPRLSSERTHAFESVAARRPAPFRIVTDLLRGWMVFRDPPAHTRLREPVRRAFTPRRIGGLADAITAATDELLDRFEEAGGGDLRSALAAPLPATVIAELLGVPRADREQFRAWSDDLARVVFAVSSRPDGPEGDEAVIAAATAFTEYFGDLLNHYRTHPAGNLLTALAEVGAGEELTPIELVGAATLLLFAGHETTTGLISSGIWSLFAHPDQWDRLGADPSVDATMADELVRYEGPVGVMVRLVAEPFAWHGHELERGQVVYLGVAAANRDPEVFVHPDRLDLGRDPNPHLGFGWGLHHCLGASLARLETRIAFRRLVERFPDLRPNEDGPQWAGGVLGRSTASVIVAI